MKSAQVSKSDYDSYDWDDMSPENVEKMTGKEGLCNEAQSLKTSPARLVEILNSKMWTAVSEAVENPNCPPEAIGKLLNDPETPKAVIESIRFKRKIQGVLDAIGEEEAFERRFEKNNRK